jgi:hypothetical protein
MEVPAIISRVVRLALEFHDRGDVSMHSLLRESGYFEVAGKITESDVLQALKESPGSVVSWQRWSESKRTGSGWFLTQTDQGRYMVGYLRDGKLTEQCETYADVTEACAAFIMREVKDINMT